MIACRSRTSAAARTNESATKSTPRPSAKSRSSRSFFVSDGIGTGTPGRLTPLCDFTSPPTTTRQRARPCSTSCDGEPHEAVVDQDVVARPEHLADHGRRDRQLAVGGRLLADDDHLLVLQQDARRRQVADPELRALQVGDQRERLAGLLLHLAHDLRALGVILVVAVREIEADRVDAGVDQRTHRVVGRRDRPDGGDDLRPAALGSHALHTSEPSSVRTTARSSAATTTPRTGGRIVLGMIYVTGTAAPALAADAFVRGAEALPLALAEYRGTWVGRRLRRPPRRRARARRSSRRPSAPTAPIVLATTPDDWHETAASLRRRAGSLPVLTEVAEQRRITIDRRPGRRRPARRLRRSARETLAALEAAPRRPAATSRSLNAQRTWLSRS